MDEEKEIAIGRLHETAFIATFIRCDRRERFRDVFNKRALRDSKNPKNRLKWKRLLTDLESWVDQEYVHVVPITEQTQDGKRRLLIEMGASETCYVISEARELDGKIMRIDDVISYLACNNVYGTIISCVPGKVAYYEHVEDLGLTWMLRKR